MQQVDLLLVMKQWRTSVRNARKVCLRHTRVKLNIHEMSSEGKKVF